MKNIYSSDIGDLMVDEKGVVIKKYRKKYYIVGNKVVVFEKQILFRDIDSIEVGTVVGNIGRITFNIKGHNPNVMDMIGFQNAFEFNNEDLKDYQDLKTELDKKI